MPKQNKYPKPCNNCGEVVAPFNGTLARQNGKWIVNHITCGAPRIHIVEFSSGAVEYRNANGRCEDAPCCGCCTI